jgi:hypothetical protein
MEKHKNKPKVREPFPPENTPEPPQVMDTSIQPESGTKESEQARLADQQKNQGKPGQKKESNKKSLGDSDSEIDDETTT